MIRYVLAVCCCVLVCGFSSQAQSQNSTAHQLAQVAVIKVDGAEHPELIPDSTAYRLYLLAVSELPNASQEERSRQDAHLGMLNISARDHLAIIGALAEFKSAYVALVSRYNKSAEAALAAGMQPDEKTFLLQRDDLVQTTRNAIKRLLTTEGMVRFDAHVQGEKNRMSIHSTKEERQ
jgi:hypothetical protein